MKGTLATYRIQNGYIVVDIDKRHYLLDIESHMSRSYDPTLSFVEIKGIQYPLDDETERHDISGLQELAGTIIDGMLAMDIIEQTSLTIYKNGLIWFDRKDIEGVRVPLLPCLGPTLVKVNGKCGKADNDVLINSGMRYGYAIKPFLDRNFADLLPYDHVSDFHPYMEMLDSDAYHLLLSIEGLPVKCVDICYNEEVEWLLLAITGTYMSVNINELFDEAIQINMDTRELVIN